MSGRGDGLQGGGLCCGRHPVTESPCLLCLSCPPSVLLLCLYTFLNMCSLCQTYTCSPESLAFLLCLSGVYICVCMCVCLLTEWGFVERDSPQSGAGNRLESEPPCPDSLISSLIHGLTAGSTRTHIYTHTLVHRHTQSQLQGPIGDERVHRDTLMLAQTPATVRTEGKFNDSIS